MNLIGGRDEQLEHYRKVRARIAVGQGPALLPPPEKKIARMVVPTIAQLDAERERREQIKLAALPEGVSSKALVEKIIREVAAEHLVPVTEMMSRSRRKTHMLSRRKAVWRIYTELGWSQARIGRYFGNDHATILQHIRGYTETQRLLKAARP